jgi:hypothetical protein
MGEYLLLFSPKAVAFGKRKERKIEPFCTLPGKLLYHSHDRRLLFFLSPNAIDGLDSFL